MIRAMILCLCLTACASQPKPRPENYGGPLTDENVCAIIGNALYCTQSATDEQQAEWVAYHTHPVTDACEARANKRIKRALFADYGTTAAGLMLCSAAVELNPLGPIGALILSETARHSVKQSRARTSRWDENRFDDSVCERDTVESMAIVRGVVATTNNLGVLAVCL